MKWLILLAGVAMNASASLLMKLAVTPPRRLPSLANPLGVFSNVPMWAGLLAYGAAFALYVVALARFPLNVAHPVLTAGAIVCVATSSVLVLQEPMHPTMVIGIALIVLGVVLLTRAH